MDPETDGVDAADQVSPEQADPAEAPPESAPADPGQPSQGAPRQATLPQPSITTGGSTTVSASVSGASAQINGGTEAAAYALVSYRVATGAMSATTEFTVNPAPGAAFEYHLIGTGSGYASRYLRLIHEPGSSTLQAASTSGVVDCGPLPSGQPTTVTLAFDGSAKTFDVLIGGARTACTDLSTKTAGPVNGVRLSDSTVQGYGGQVNFSDIVLLY
ncbi:MAG TPA: hypothetical protein VLM79_34640 [Kofleriaceae bacterium]|nr:hypothetical protein [Kofleriaceae bacterium]